MKLKQPPSLLVLTAYRCNLRKSGCLKQKFQTYLILFLKIENVGYDCAKAY